MFSFASYGTDYCNITKWKLLFRETCRDLSEISHLITFQWDRVSPSYLGGMKVLNYKLIHYEVVVKGFLEMKYLYCTQNRKLGKCSFQFYVHLVKTNENSVLKRYNYFWFLRNVHIRELLNFSCRNLIFFYRPMIQQITTQSRKSRDLV